jgi:hypothetical protein
MSLCYDFQKWTMISLAMVTIRLTIGLISMVHGQGVNMDIKSWTQIDMNNKTQIESFYATIQFEKMQCLFEKMKFEHDNATDFQLKFNETRDSCLLDFLTSKKYFTEEDIERFKEANEVLKIK